MRARPRPESGSAALEAAVGLPAFMLFVALVILGGRLAIATQSVQASAAEAARVASIARTHTQASTTATAAARSSLSNQRLDCTTSTVTLDTTGFDAPVGTPAQVSATVTCTIALADLSLPGVPGQRTVSASSSSPIDTYRERDSGFNLTRGNRIFPRIVVQHHPRTPRSTHHDGTS